MNKIQKFIDRLSKDKKLIVFETIDNVILGRLDNLDVRKLRGKENTFRVRIGRIRVIFVQRENGYEIIDVTNRDDNTYN
jgi:mRNA-degrading endonuclease RelE of RelBE toxin-antitoxin system